MPKGKPIFEVVNNEGEAVERNESGYMILYLGKATANEGEQIREQLPSDVTIELRPGFPPKDKRKIKGPRGALICVLDNSGEGPSDALTFKTTKPH